MSKWNKNLELTPLMALSIMALLLLMPVFFALVRSSNKTVTSRAAYSTPTPRAYY